MAYRIKDEATPIDVEKTKGNFSLGELLNNAMRNTVRGQVPYAAPMMGYSEDEKAGYGTVQRGIQRPQQAFFEYNLQPEQGVKQAWQESGKTYRKEKKPLSVRKDLFPSRSWDLENNPSLAGEFAAAFFEVLADPLYLIAPAIEGTTKLAGKVTLNRQVDMLAKRIFDRIVPKMLGKGTVTALPEFKSLKVELINRLKSFKFPVRGKQIQIGNFKLPVTNAGKEMNMYQVMQQQGGMKFIKDLFTAPEVAPGTVNLYAGVPLQIPKNIIDKFNLSSEMVNNIQKGITTGIPIKALQEIMKLNKGLSPQTPENINDQTGIDRAGIKQEGVSGGMSEGTGLNPLDYGSAEEFVEASLDDVAQTQRGTPEQSRMPMFDVSFLHGDLMEVAGDLIHRMYESPSFFKGAHAMEKIRMLKNRLLSDNIREMEDSVTVEEKKQMKPILENYANEYRKLPAYNETQQKAKDIPILISEGKYQEASKLVNELETLYKDKESWVKAITQSKQLTDIWNKAQPVSSTQEQNQFIQGEAKQTEQTTAKHQAEATPSEQEPPIQSTLRIKTGKPDTASKVILDKVSILKDFKNIMPADPEVIKTLRANPDLARANGIAITTNAEGKEKVAIRDSGFYAEAGIEYVDVRDAYSLLQAPHHMALMQDNYELGGAFGTIFKKLWIPTKRAVANSASQKKKFDMKFRGILKKHNFPATKKSGQYLSNMLEDKIETPVKLQGLVSEMREYMDTLREVANVARGAMNRKLIGYIENYIPHIQEADIWNDLIGNMMTGDGQIDFMVPNEATNPFAFRRMKQEMEGAERNFFKLIDRYHTAVCKDMFITPAIENINAYNDVLKARGIEKSAKYWDDYIRQGLLGRQANLDAALNVSEGVRKVSKKWNDMMNKAFLTGKVSWNLATQPLSYITLTPEETSSIKSIKAVFKWFSKGTRQMVRENSLSLQIKSNDVLADAVGEGRGYHNRIYRTPIDKWNDMLSVISSAEECWLHGMSYIAGLEQAKHLGYTGEDAHMFADLVAERTQSMYNKENRALILNSDILKSIFPFQSFSVELSNHAKEALTKDSGAMKLKRRERLGKIIMLIIGIFLANQYSRALTGKSKTTVGTFIPFAGEYVDRGIDMIRGEEYSGSRSPISIIQQGDNLIKGCKQFMETGSTSTLRKIGLNFGLAAFNIGGGGQINNVIDGIIANKTGEVQSASGKTTLFKVDDLLSKIKAPVFGVWSTKGGRDYWDDKETRRGINKLINKAGVADTEKKLLREVQSGVNKNLFGKETADGYRRSFYKEKYKIEGDIFSSENIVRFANMKTEDFDNLMLTYTERTRKRIRKKMRVTGNFKYSIKSSGTAFSNKQPLWQIK